MSMGEGVCKHVLLWFQYRGFFAKHKNVFVTEHFVEGLKRNWKETNPQIPHKLPRYLGSV